MVNVFLIALLKCVLAYSSTSTDTKVTKDCLNSNSSSDAICVGSISSNYEGIGISSLSSFALNNAPARQSTAISIASCSESPHVER